LYPRSSDPLLFPKSSELLSGDRPWRGGHRRIAHDLLQALHSTVREQIASTSFFRRLTSQTPDTPESRQWPEGRSRFSAPPQAFWLARQQQRL
jgi:hypothetical protein